MGRLRGSRRLPHPLLLPLVLDPPVRIRVEGELEQEAVVVGVLLWLDAVLLEDALVRLRWIGGKVRAVPMGQWLGPPL